MALKGTVANIKGVQVDALKFDMDGAEILPKVEDMLKRFGKLRFEFGEIVRSITKYNQRQFKLKGNGRYEPLSKAYARFKTRAFAPAPRPPILVFSGRLRASVTNSATSDGANADTIINITDTSMEFGTRVPYAAAINFGYKDRNLPARPFLIWDEGRVRAVNKILDSAASRRVEVALA